MWRLIQRGHPLEHTRQPHDEISAARQFPEACRLLLLVLSVAAFTFLNLDKSQWCQGNSLIDA